MKTIYFIRHSKSDQNTQCEDFERPLNRRGEKDAPFMAKRLKHYKVKPDIIISSPAKRTLDTATIIAKILKYSKEKIVLKKELYDSTYNDYLDVIKSIDNKYKNIFIVGHNPAITEVCEILSNSIIGNIPTTGIFCIKFDVENFQDIESQNGKVVFFDLPKKHSVK
ncbi:MAG: histidine phosphatase family protein [Campylobacteraceae bacterium]|jgi:phosphohistidine phosphatase|nr:histidine phosphatase family protein [Campylobacteraceae bacterium]